jgi:hypothetical protein
VNVSIRVVVSSHISSHATQFLIFFVSIRVSIRVLVPSHVTQFLIFFSPTVICVCLQCKHTRLYSLTLVVLMYAWIYVYMCVFFPIDTRRCVHAWHCGIYAWLVFSSRFRYFFLSTMNSWMHTAQLSAMVTDMWIQCIKSLSSTTVPLGFLSISLSDCGDCVTAGNCDESKRKQWSRIMYLNTSYRGRLLNLFESLRPGFPPEVRARNTEYAPACKLQRPYHHWMPVIERGKTLKFITRQTEREECTPTLEIMVTTALGVP